MSHAGGGDSRRPDAHTESLVPGRSCAIEIAAPSNNRISGEDVMDRITRKIGECADLAIRGVGKYLYFTFGEESGYSDGSYARRRLAPKAFDVPIWMSVAIKEWIKSGKSESEAIRFVDDGLDVQIERKSYKQTRYHNFHSSIPSEVHSLENNPLYELLCRKKGQLKAAAQGTYRMLFVADVGSTLLNRLGSSQEIDYTGRRVSGREIISHFMVRNCKHIDAVVVFSPRREWSSFASLGPFGQKSRRWEASFFGSAALANPPQAIDDLLGKLPDPHYEGYQARSLFRQGSFSPSAHGQYLGMTIESKKGGDMRVKFPARMLLDLLAGRMTEERFRLQLEGSPGSTNLFKRWLDMGLTISGAEMAPREIDEDDDHMILYFSDDPAARDLRLSRPEPSHESGHDSGA